MGLVVLLFGLMVRVWSMQTLSEAYSRTLKVTDQQITVDRGPYQHVRHPGYLGSLLIWTGFALTSGSPTVCACVGGLLVPTYARRMKAEEQLLERRLVGYSEYRARTKKLVPGLW
jgi:protein-S-isoprenylcysteine O-methyltransferase